MRRKVTWALLFAAGLLIGMAFSGVFDAPGPTLSAAGRDPVVAGNDLEQLRDFAGKFETLFQSVAEVVSPAVVLVQVEKTEQVQVPDLFFGNPLEDFFSNPFGALPRAGAVRAAAPRARRNAWSAGWAQA